MNIQKKVSLPVVLMLIIFSIEMIVYNQYSTNNSVENAVSETAINMARTVEQQLDKERYAEMYANPIENDLYWELREELNTLRETIGAMYLYTLQVDGSGKVTFLIEGAERGEETAVPINGDTYINDLGVADVAIETGSAATDIIETEFGQYLSSCNIMNAINVYIYRSLQKGGNLDENEFHMWNFTLKSIWMLDNR